MFGEDFLQRAIIAAPAFLFALTIHEFFHGYIALRFGDTTARDMGRLTLNPLAHLDLFGTIVFFFSGFRFGWAKPVPVNPFNLKEPRKADFWISAAGPLSNLGLGLIFGILFRFAVSMGPSMPNGLHQFLFYSVMINVSLAFFNLIPLFPLDGSHILRSVVPERHGPALDQFERFAPFVLLLVVISGATWMILGPPVSYFVNLFAGVRIG